MRTLILKDANSEIVMDGRFNVWRHIASFPKSWWVLFGFLAVFNAMDAAWGQMSDFDQPPINYQSTPGNDDVAKLAKRLETGEAKLQFDHQTGYLKSLLKELRIPVSSQTLVFSKTSLQIHRISPRRPRALYYNDNIYVGYVQHGDVLEIAATDPNQGAIFYTLSQEPSGVPEFVRDQGNCLSCHATSRTQHVPGYLMRSVYPDAAGQPKLSFGTFVTDSKSEFDQRWGGWYVTGSHGSMRHMGNVIADDTIDGFDREKGANQSDLSDHFLTDSYLLPSSDIVALMVLGHQSQMHNAIAAANFETRRALHQSFEMNRLLDRPDGYVSESANRRIQSSIRRVLEHLLMCGEFQLDDPVAGSPEFSRDFSAMASRDSKGRSLRDLNLETRLFDYPCSYLIHSDAFASLPDRVRVPVLNQLRLVLEGKDDSAEYSHLDEDTKRTILEILLDTHAEFRQHYQASNGSVSEDDR